MIKDISFKDKKAIIFDLDGTIVRLDVDWTNLKRTLSRRFNRLYGDQCEFESISRCLENIVEKNDDLELLKFFKIIKEHELKNIKNNKYIEETLYFINNLKLFGVKEGTKLAIFSLNTRQTIIDSLQLVNIFEKFHFFVGREDVRKWKPHPDGLLKIQKFFNLRKDEIIYIGDLEKDIIAGRNAGIETHLIEDLIHIVKRVRAL